MQNTKLASIKMALAIARTSKGGTALLALALALSTGLIASPAAAAGPTKSPFTKISSGVITGLCQFDIHVDQTFAGTEIDFFDNSGNLTRADYHLVWQDTLTANGKTLVSLPIHGQFQFVFDSAGNLTNLILNGVYEKIRLPDGSTFVNAGHGDLLVSPLFPEHGNSGQTALCAALAP